ncbi:MAG TPA: hypothetical protein VN081_00005, partial [Dongiaceae bacterium]|nr:hypothetical protein [Dongiaceae bacterium]
YQPQQQPSPDGQTISHGQQPQPYGPSPLPQPSPVPMPQAGGYTPLPPASASPLARKPSKLWLILTFVFIFTTLCGGGASAWALINYFDQKDNVDSKVSTAVASAVKTQADKDAADFLQKEKEPNRQFVGPDDYGRLSFDYPKTWSVYIAQDIKSNGDTYQAFFNPVEVPPVNSSSTQQYALRVTIQSQDYDKVVATYQSLVTKGSLTSSSVQADGQNGTRLDGAFSQNIHGSAVIFKIRDKTVTVQTDAQAFSDDFNALVKTITFNK